MNEMQKDQFDILISAAVVQCVHGDADNLSCVDTSGVPDTSRLHKKVMRNLPGRRRTVVKAAVATALIAALLALTACACLPEIRDYFWSVVTQWYGDHFEITFESEHATTEEFQTTAPEAKLPTTIEQIAKLMYVPHGCYIAKEISLPSQHYVEYFVEEEWRFAFSQNVYDKTSTFVDDDNANVQHIQVNGYNGVLTEAADGEVTTYCLTWQDEQYRYSLQGCFSSIPELMQIAESLSLNGNS